MVRQDISGRWTGLMLDAEGRRARINASVEVSDGEVSGSVEYSIIDAENLYDQKGEVQGRLDGDEAYLEFRVETRGGPMSVQFTGRVRDAGTHARATMYGSYEVAGEGADDLSGGVAILWLYVDRE